MKLTRAVTRIGILSLAAAVFVALTQGYARSVRVPSPGLGWLAERVCRPSAPDFGKFPEAVGAFVVLVIYAVGGRIVFRVRLAPTPRSESRAILLGLHPSQMKTTKPSEL
jgi:hypothetical protein